MATPSKSNLKLDIKGDFPFVLSDSCRSKLALVTRGSEGLFAFNLDESDLHSPRQCFGLLLVGKCAYASAKDWETCFMAVLDLLLNATDPLSIKGYASFTARLSIEDYLSYNKNLCECLVFDLSILIPPTLWTRHDSDLFKVSHIKTNIIDTASITVAQTWCLYVLSQPGPKSVSVIVFSGPTPAPLSFEDSLDRPFQQPLLFLLCFGTSVLRYFVSESAFDGLVAPAFRDLMRNPEITKIGIASDMQQVAQRIGINGYQSLPTAARSLGVPGNTVPDVLACLTGLQTAPLKDLNWSSLRRQDLQEWTTTALTVYVAHQQLELLRIQVETNNSCSPLLHCIEDCPASDSHIATRSKVVSAAEQLDSTAEVKEESPSKLRVYLDSMQQAARDPNGTRFEPFHLQACQDPNLQIARAITDKTIGVHLIDPRTVLKNELPPNGNFSVPPDFIFEDPSALTFFKLLPEADSGTDWPEVSEDERVAGASEPSMSRAVADPSLPTISMPVPSSVPTPLLPNGVSSASASPSSFALRAAGTPSSSDAKLPSSASSGCPWILLSNAPVSCSLDCRKRGADSEPQDAMNVIKLPSTTQTRLEKEANPSTDTDEDDGGPGPVDEDEQQEDANRNSNNSQ